MSKRDNYSARVNNPHVTAFWRKGCSASHPDHRFPPAPLVFCKLCRLFLLPLAQHWRGSTPILVDSARGVRRKQIERRRRTRKRDVPMIWRKEGTAGGGRLGRSRHKIPQSCPWASKGTMAICQAHCPFSPLFNPPLCFNLHIPFSKFFFCLDDTVVTRTLHTNKLIRRHESSLSIRKVSVLSEWL